MNDQLHTLLDGEDPGENSGSLFASEAERREFAEHRRLQQAMRRQADVGALSASEKATMGAALAATIGLETPNPVPTSVPTTAAVPVPAPGRRRLIGATIFAVGIGLGAGLFALLDGDDAAGITRTEGIIIPSETTTPSLFPFALPEPSAAEECADEIARLQSSMQKMEPAKSTKASVKQKRVVKRKGRKLPVPVPGERVGP